MPAVFIHGVSVRQERFNSLLAQVGRELGHRLPDMPVSGAYWGDQASSLRFGGASIPGFVAGARGARAPAAGLEDTDLSDLLLEEPLVELQALADRSKALTGAAAALAAAPAAVQRRNESLDKVTPGLVETLAA